MYNAAHRYKESFSPVNPFLFPAYRSFQHSAGHSLFSHGGLTPTNKEATLYEKIRVFLGTDPQGQVQS